MTPCEAITCVASQGVIGYSSLQLVVARSAFKQVISAPRFNLIISSIAVDDVIAPAADQRVAPIASFNSLIINIPPFDE